jgi:ATP-dependent protease Clp ATPase subunit
MFDMPSRNDVGRVVVDAEVVRNKANPTLVPPQEIARERSA